MSRYTPAELSVMARQVREDAEVGGDRAFATILSTARLARVDANEARDRILAFELPIRTFATRRDLMRAVEVSRGT